MIDLKVVELSISIEDVKQVFPELTEEKIFDILYEANEDIKEKMIWAAWREITKHLPDDIEEDPHYDTSIDNDDEAEGDGTGEWSQSEPGSPPTAQIDCKAERLHYDSSEQLSEAVPQCGLLLHS